MNSSMRSCMSLRVHEPIYIYIYVCIYIYSPFIELLYLGIPFKAHVNRNRQMDL